MILEEAGGCFFSTKATKCTKEVAEAGGCCCLNRRGEGRIAKSQSSKDAKDLMLERSMQTL